MAGTTSEAVQKKPNMQIGDIFFIKKLAAVFSKTCPKPHMLRDLVAVPTLKMSLLSFPPPTPQPRSRSSATLNILRILNNNIRILKSIIEYLRDWIYNLHDKG